MNGPKLENVTKLDKKNAISFAVSVVFALALLVISPEWVWVAFPFICTYFVKMFDWL